MIRLPDHDFARRRRLLRGELAAAWDHLTSAALLDARQLGQASRERGRVARGRAIAASKALSGDQPAAPWRWLGAGLAAGVVIGAVGVTALRRGDREARVVSEQAHAAAERARAAAAKAGDTVHAAQEGTGSAVRAVGDSAREAADKVRRRFTRDDSRGEAEPTGRSEEEAES